MGQDCLLNIRSYPITGRSPIRHLGTRLVGVLSSPEPRNLRPCLLLRNFNYLRLNLILWAFVCKSPLDRRLNKVFCSFCLAVEEALILQWTFLGIGLVEKLCTFEFLGACRQVGIHNSRVEFVIATSVYVSKGRLNEFFIVTICC